MSCSHCLFTDAQKSTTDWRETAMLLSKIRIWLVQIDGITIFIMKKVTLMLFSLCKTLLLYVKEIEWGKKVSQPNVFSNYKIKPSSFDGCRENRKRDLLARFCLTLSVSIIIILNLEKEGYYMKFLMIIVIYICRWTQLSWITFINLKGSKYLYVCRVHSGINESYTVPILLFRWERKINLNNWMTDS